MFTLPVGHQEKGHHAQYPPPPSCPTTGKGSENSRTTGSAWLDKGVGFIKGKGGHGSKNCGTTGSVWLDKPVVGQGQGGYSSLDGRSTMQRNKRVFLKLDWLKHFPKNPKKAILLLLVIGNLHTGFSIFFLQKN